MFTSEVNAIGFKELGIDWIGFQNFEFFVVDMTWRLRLLFWTSSVVLFLDTETKEIPKLDSISVSF
jgi:hypothetical protein